jgi:hypothetical protein
MRKQCILRVSFFSIPTVVWTLSRGVVGADQERDMTSAVTSVLGRLPGAQLYTLDAVVKHLKE